MEKMIQELTVACQDGIDIEAKTDMIRNKYLSEIEGNSYLKDLLLK